jgi:hypothetical protein
MTPESIATRYGVYIVRDRKHEGRALPFAAVADQTGK